MNKCVSAVLAIILFYGMFAFIEFLPCNWITLPTFCLLCVAWGACLINTAFKFVEKT